MRAGEGRPDLAVLAATSGHSGVDRVLSNLVPAMAALGLRVDVLGIDGHGPEIGDAPPLVRRHRLGAQHVNTAVPGLLAYLRRTRPRALLSDKDRVNRIALLARRLAGVPTRVGVRIGTTVSVNLASRGFVERSLQRASMCWAYPAADAILVPSHGVAEDLAVFAGLVRDRITVVQSPVITATMVGLAEQLPTHPWFGDGGPPLVLGVGELSERKDFATLIRAFARLPAHRSCRLMILGEGRRRSELESLVRELGIGDRVALPGFVPNPYAYMARAAVFVSSSRWEGMPIVLIEALALGAACVACDCPSGPREVLDDGRVGPLVPPGDDEALAVAIAAQLERPRDAHRSREAVAAYRDIDSAKAYLAALGFEEFA
ncbi:glycosyltransferase [Rhodocyclaceae bacterium SMB388]